MPEAHEEPELPPIRKTRTVFNSPGHAHLLTFSCQKRLPLLNRDRSRQWLVESLAAARARFSFELWAFVIMPEHAHVLLFPTGANYDVSNYLSAVKLPVARRAVRWLRQNSPEFLNHLKVERPGGRVEYRFWLQGGGYDNNIIKPDTAWSAVKYLHDNPVRRGLVPQAVDWRWSSARQYAGLDDAMLPVDGCPH